ncbi:hypothetical protein [Rufibacter roseolus]|uniref:hypothetical protein n=1 Tax=Rufibacter roseolus TaxID=2817375 RepID=UPI001B3069E5|nr:hypothetical protein [Rufibacter roseolus]
MLRKTMIVGLLGLAIIIALIGYPFYKLFNTPVKSKGGCGISAILIQGQKVKIKLSTIKINTYLEIPDGQLAISNTNASSKVKDTSPPILIKLDKNQKVVWAIKLDSEEAKSGIPLYSMTDIKLLDDKEGKRISFFNLSYMEPGKIYLKDNYDFDYMCLSPF